MLASMTGFVTKTIDVSLHGTTVSFTVTLKTLNARFFECTFKLPHQLAALEPEIHRLLKSSLYRGSALCSIYVSSLAPLSGPIKPSLTTVQDYLAAAHDIQEKFSSQYSFDERLSINTLISLPYVFEQVECTVDASVEKFLLKGIEELTKKLVQDRLREGVALQKDLEGRAEKMATLLASIEKRAKKVVADRRKKIIKETQEFLENSSPDAKEHQLQLIYNQLEKIDIHEEITRFNAHLKHFQENLTNAQKEKGRKLDFILQELFREVNTIAAKCSDSELSSQAIAIKVELEKAREQTQNIV